MRILVVKMVHVGHNLGSRVIFFGLSNLVFDVDIGLLLSTPGEVADLAAEYEMHMIGVLSQVAGHLSLLPELRYDLWIRRIRRRTRGGGGGKGGIE